MAHLTIKCFTLHSSPFSHQIRISKPRKVIKLAGYDELAYFYFHGFDWILHYNLKITIREDAYTSSSHSFSAERLIIFVGEHLIASMIFQMK
jgi:hypothetical protein